MLGSRMDRVRKGQCPVVSALKDPLHSVAARDAVDKKAGVYEAVNKPSEPKDEASQRSMSPASAVPCCFWLEVKEQILHWDAQRES